jgi:hypothetical protein
MVEFGAANPWRWKNLSHLFCWCFWFFEFGFGIKQVPLASLFISWGAPKIHFQYILWILSKTNNIFYGFNLCAPIVRNLIIFTRAFNQIKSQYVSICWDILWTNLLKRHYDVIWLNACVKICYTVTA